MKFDVRNQCVIKFHKKNQSKPKKFSLPNKASTTFVPRSKEKRLGEITLTEGGAWWLWMLASSDLEVDVGGGVRWLWAREASHKMGEDVNSIHDLWESFWQNKMGGRCFHFSG
jgi:hypothetical protein